MPGDCGAALDVGCGTGRFARRLAGLGVEVDGIDQSESVVGEARSLSGRTVGDAGNPRYRHLDITEAELPSERYDFVSCLACIHHVPFHTVSRLRDALAPRGVLVILGCYREEGPRDLAWALVAAPLNAVARIAVVTIEWVRRRGSGRSGRSRLRAPIASPKMSLREVREEAAALLPGCEVRRLLFWRYLLVFRNGV